MKTHLTTEDVYDLAYSKLDISNIKVDKEQELAQMLDLDWDDSVDMYRNPDIFWTSDPNAYSLEWMQGLNKSGYAGVNKQGTIVDRRQYNDAIPVKENSLFGVVKPLAL